MSVYHVQHMALGLAGVFTPMLVEVVTKHKHPRLTVQAIEQLITPTSRYALEVIQNILLEVEQFEELSPATKLYGISTQLQEDPYGEALMGGVFVLIGTDLTAEEVSRTVAGNGEAKPFCGPDSAIYLPEHPDVILSFHATNNNGGNTYVMTRDQFVTLFPEEPIEVLHLKT